MTIDPSIREQTYPYFLQEATELLRTLEQGLLTLRQDFDINKIHNLMRVTHTLKGAAASVELETIALIAHALEDIFKALCQPGVFFDLEVESLLFEGYECLSLALATEQTEGGVSNAEILDRAANVFAQLQEKLGDWIGQTAALPTSADLGFDVMQSMFEVGVAQRLDQLAIAIATAQTQTISTVLRTQAEVFFGLAESLDLPGFGAIARAAILALDRHPEQVVTIARCALSDFQKGQAAVLAGDRRQGGQPSKTLQELAGLLSGDSARKLADRDQGASSDLAVQTIAQSPKSSGLRNIVQRIWNFILEDPQSAAQPPSPPKAEKEADLASTPPLLESIWGGYIAPDEPPKLSAPAEAPAQMELHTSEQDPEIILTTSLATIALDKPEDQPVAEPEIAIQTVPLEHPAFGLPSAAPDKRVARTHAVRVNVEDLKYLSYSVGELLTNQNRQGLQQEQLQTEVRSLLKKLKHHQQRLSQLYEYPDLDAKVSSVSSNNPKNFDSLEFDRYTDSHLLIQSLLDDTVQLSEAVEAVDLFVRQSSQTLEKQHLLLANAHNALIEARMLALGEILNRFPNVLQQLETLHNKQVTLEIQGADVLVDKVVAEKLYEPLLHIVRNAFDHGIESRLVRQQRGKPEKGRLEIRAYHQSRYLVIEICDDGEGLDFERIRQRAVECHLIPPEQASRLSQSQLTDLLFEPGFSTVAQVNTLSGRGIGLDVVQNQLQTLQASIAVDSELHQGTTFTLQIPLDLAIAKLLICQSHAQPYAFLTQAIEHILVPQPHQIRQRESGKVLRWQKDEDETEQLIPLYSLSEILDYHSFAFQPVASGSIPDQYVILVRCPQGLVGLAVDQLVGEQELVIRPLGTAIESPRYIQGASVLADGRLTPVIAVSELFQLKVFDADSKFSSVATAQPKGVQALPVAQLPSQTSPPLEPSPPIAKDLNSAILPAISPTISPAILIVEDSITTRQTLTLALQKSGYRVVQAKDGREALDHLQQQPEVRLVICDLEMPRMNGFEFLSHCQHHADLARLPVIILTSRSSEKHRLLASQLGAAAYLTKPYIEHKLLNMVSHFLAAQND